MMPSAIAATPDRSMTNVALLASRPPLPRNASSLSPSSRSRPTRTSSRNSIPVGDECRPILRNGFDCSRPGMPVSSTNCNTVRSAGGLPSSSLQMNTIVSAYGPFVMNVFDPLSRYSSPSRRAVDAICPNASEPELGSVIAHAPILSSVNEVARPALALRDRALRVDRGRREPDRHAQRGDHARRALAQLDDRQQREARRRATPAVSSGAVLAARRRAASSAAMRWSKPSAAIWSIPNVLYILRRRSYGGRSPCSSSSRCGRISLSTNWRTASRTIWSSSGHSNIAGSYGTASTRSGPSRPPGTLRAPLRGFSRRLGDADALPERRKGPGEGTGWIPPASAWSAHCRSTARSWATCCCGCAATRAASVAALDLGDRGAAEVDVLLHVGRGGVDHHRPALEPDRASR